MVFRKIFVQLVILKPRPRVHFCADLGRCRLVIFRPYAALLTTSAEFYGMLHKNYQDQIQESGNCDDIRTFLILHWFIVLQEANKFINNGVN